MSGIVNLVWPLTAPSTICLQSGDWSVINKVLLVDDDPNVRLVAQIGLADVGGWDVVEAANGREAVALAEKYQPDLILLDVMMPMMDGLSTLTELRAIPQLADTPVIFLTAKVQEDEREQYLSLGAIGVIMKPFDPLTLPENIVGLLSNACKNANLNEKNPRN